MANCRFLLLLMFTPVFFIGGTAQHDEHAEMDDHDHRRHYKQCRITVNLYRDLRMLSEDNKHGMKNCSAAGCFFMYPPKDSDSNFFPNRMLSVDRSRSSSSHLVGLNAALQGCRSDIPFMLQRVSFSKDIKLHRMLRYLRACFVRDIRENNRGFNNGTQQMKNCQPEMANKTNSLLSKRSWLEQNTYFAENNCFYPFYRQAVFYASFGQHSEGRVVCCSDGRIDEEESFKENCKKLTDHIYAAKAGWRKGKDAQ
ncbi:hypothetical protein niasHS_011754 [Heterodera schachtii]|uniref:Uncharacterized protein n=1 Tax=Heterodera schachtii TaxID=97005 RepID=A0ABD2IK97_HETSC